MAGCSFKAIVEEDLQEDTDETKKRQVMWDWKKGSPKIPVKKMKMADNEEKNEKYVCLQCLKQYLQGKRDKGIIKEAVALYLRGDDVIKAHKKITFFSGRAKEYFVSKVVDRHHADSGCCPFLADTE
ncbi:Hypothetical predicted protein [Paramuricea clavata]|uniref:Uncharacterized protein n=1 Tax=Paramuricea clavata TaxID=317549 RepID=A0A6S7FU34_PARCT|nr:Hypothetical predicted protein [Paramuricea clavata]